MKRWIFIYTFAPQVSDWLYDEGSDADAAIYEAKLNELKTLTGPLYRRVKEHMERPEALAALHSMINGSSYFLANARNMTTDSPDGLFTQVELGTLERVINETQVHLHLLHLGEEWGRSIYVPVFLRVLKNSWKLNILTIQN